ncbi:hypothetical protein BRD10_03530, partial [Halobacteriales archaeon SW_12_71_31]
LVLVLLVLRQVGGESLSAVLLSVVEGALTPTGRGLFIETVESGPRLSGTSALGVVVLTWAMLRIFRGMDQAFSAVYDTGATNTMADQILDGLVVFGAVTAAVVGAGLLRTTVTLGDGVLGTTLTTLFVIVALSVALYPLYFVFPDIDLPPVEALPGTLAAAVGLTALESLFRVYVQVSSAGERYGVVGGIVLVLAWLYFNGVVVLLGAVLNAVLTNRSADVTVEPVIGDHRAGLDAPSGSEEATTVEIAVGGDSASRRNAGAARRADRGQRLPDGSHRRGGDGVAAAVAAGRRRRFRGAGGTAAVVVVRKRSSRSPSKSHACPSSGPTPAGGVARSHGARTAERELCSPRCERPAAATAAEN